MRPIQNKPNLVRDPSTGAIFNIDSSAFNVHKKEKESKEQIERNLKEINIIKSDVLEIKNMLKELLERK
tara:strand:+ start:47 stop:253 length:207 start_codon:yes stop_codon:yes gene_type:complete